MLRECSGAAKGMVHMQGREKDIVIFSAVRSREGRKPHARIGFVADERRLNVGLTRARASLLVVGNFAALQSDANWRALVQHAKDSGCAHAQAAMPAHNASRLLPACSALSSRTIRHPCCPGNASSWIQ